MAWKGNVAAMIVNATSRICVGFDSCSIPWKSMTAVFVPSNAAMIVQRLSWEEVRLSTLTESSLMIHSSKEWVSIYRCLNGLKPKFS